VNDGKSARVSGSERLSEGVGRSECMGLWNAMMASSDVGGEKDKEGELWNGEDAGMERPRSFCRGSGSGGRIAPEAEKRKALECRWKPV
jgi:hypothetical protein